MSQIEITCIDQTAIYTDTPEIFSGDVNVDTVKFIFDDSWNDYTNKTAVFYNDPKNVYPQILDVNDVAVIPSQVIANKCKLSIGVVGTNANGDIKTSKILTYNAGKGTISDDLESSTATPDIWLQILTQIDELRTFLDGRQGDFETQITQKQDDFETQITQKQDSMQAQLDTALANRVYVYALNDTVSDDYVSALTLPYNFVYGGAVVLNNEIHLLGGFDGNFTKHYKWNGTTWTSVSTLPYDFYLGGAVVLNNEIHMLGGAGNKINHYKFGHCNFLSGYVKANVNIYLPISTIAYTDNLEVIDNGYRVTQDGYVKILIE